MIENIKPYPVELRDMTTFIGFRTQFYVELRKDVTNKVAYEATELIYIKYFGRRKYANWRTFNELRSRNARK